MTTKATKTTEAPVEITTETDALPEGFVRVRVLKMGSGKIFAPGSGVGKLAVFRQFKEEFVTNLARATALEDKGFVEIQE